MIRLIGILLSLFVLFQNAEACLNEYEEDYTRIDGSYRHITEETEGSSGYYFYRESDKDELRRKKESLEQSGRLKIDFELRSDYAVILMRLGEQKKALHILEELVKDHPNEYNIVVNLGTAYELNNNPENALKYISKAVKLNSKSHKGSEWIHVEILKAKIALKGNKDYLKENSVLQLNIPENIESYYQSLTVDQKKHLIEVKDQLAWQLKERINLVAPPDPIVADLLSDLGNLVALTESVENAIVVYEQALEYLPEKFREVLRRRDKLKEITYWTMFRRYGGFITAFLITAFICIYFFRRRKANKRKAAKINNKSNEKEVVL